ncbi:MAG: tetratricopeptide repeat protein [Pirellulaceae bacterium]
MNRLADISLVIVGIAVVLLSIGWVYHTSLANDLVADDPWAIERNTSIRQLFPLWGTDKLGGPLRPQLGTPFSARPLVNLTFAVNYHFGGLNVWGYRVVQIAMHMLATLVLWAVVLETLRLPCFGRRFQHTALLYSIASALIWGLHPLNTETIAYLTQRTELMMGMFMLIVVWACIRFWRAGAGKSRCGWFALAWAACLLGILCKETMATAPAVVACYWWVFVRPKPIDSLASAGPGKLQAVGVKPTALLLTALATCWIVVGGIYWAGYVTPGGGFGYRIDAVDWWYTQSHAVFLYWKLCFWPSPLTIHYAFPIHHQLSECWPWVLSCGLAFLATCFMLVRRSSLGFVLATFFIVLSPTLVIPLPGETIAERRMYVPLAAIAPLVIIFFVDSLRDVLAKFWKDGSRRHVTCLVSMVPVAALAIFFAVQSHQRMPDYRTQVSIWRDAMNKQPYNAVATMNYGVMLAAADQFDDGLVYLEKAIQIDPQHNRARFNLGYAYEAARRFGEAEQQYEKAIELGEDAATHYNLARLLEDRGEYEQAIDRYRDACRLRVDFADAHTNLGLLLFDPYRSGQANRQEAVEHFELAWEHSPDSQNGLMLAAAYLQTHKLVAAMTVATQVQEMCDDDPVARNQAETLIRQIHAMESNE